MASPSPVSGPCLVIVVVANAIGKGDCEASSRCVILESQLVRYLSAALTAAKLAAVLEAWVNVDGDVAVVQFGVAKILYGVESLLGLGVDDEAEAAGRKLEPVQSHHYALYGAALAKQFVDLLLRGVERQVSHVHGA